MAVALKLLVCQGCKKMSVGDTETTDQFTHDYSLECPYCHNRSGMAVFDGHAQTVYPNSQGTSKSWNATVGETFGYIAQEIENLHALLGDSLTNTEGRSLLEQIDRLRVRLEELESRAYLCPVPEHDDVAVA